MRNQGEARAVVLVADDVLMQAASAEHLQALLNVARDCASWKDTEWYLPKCDYFREEVTERQQCI